MFAPTLVCAGILLLASVADPSEAEATAKNQSESIKLKTLLKPIEPCIMDAVFSFVIARSNPPTSAEALAETCKRHAESFRCIKDGSKMAPPLVKRGLLTLVSNRQRANRKFCTNLQSEQSKRVLRDFKCIMERRLAHYRAIDTEYVNRLNAIQQQNYNNSALELKQFCCATYKFRRDTIEGAGEECAPARQTMEEIITSTIPNDIALLCEDEEKLARSCAEVNAIKVSKEFDLATSMNPSATGLYLVATLGVAE